MDDGNGGEIVKEKYSSCIAEQACVCMLPRPLSFTHALISLDGVSSTKGNPLW